MENDVIQTEVLASEPVVKAVEAGGNPVVGLLIGLGVSAVVCATAYVGKKIYLKIKDAKDSAKKVTEEDLTEPENQFEGKVIHE